MDFVDFGMGEPREETPAFIREALAAAIEPLSSYPSADGLPELRAAIAGWARRRFGAALDPDREIVPTLGSKEAIFHLAQVAGGELIATPTPAYPVYERGAAFAGSELLELPLTAERGFLPDLDAVDAATWDRVGVLWLNYPNNPTAATAPLEFYERAAALAREHDFVLASDEAYSELYFGDEPPASALQVADRTNVLVFNTLSKRSSMPGYRTGSRPATPRSSPRSSATGRTSAWRRWRWSSAPPSPPGATRRTSRRSAAATAPSATCCCRCWRRGGLRSAGGDATFFLWLDAGPDAEALAARLIEGGVIVTPGSYFGAAGEGFLRMALVPPLADCERAVSLLERLL